MEENWKFDISSSAETAKLGILKVNNSFEYILHCAGQERHHKTFLIWSKLRIPAKRSFVALANDLFAREQCDQMGLFSKILVTNYFSKVAHMFGDFWDILKISLFKVKTTFGLLFIPVSGHTARQTLPK